MARTRYQYESPHLIDEDDNILPEDLDAARALFPKSDRFERQEERKRIPMPPNPSEPRQLYLPGKMLNEILPQLQEAAKDEAEFETNLRHVFKELFKRQHGSEPDANDMTGIDDNVKLQMELYRFRKSMGEPTSPAGGDPLIRRHHEELQQWLDDSEK